MGTIDKEQEEARPTAVILQFPAKTDDAETIARGREAALEKYSNAKTNAERLAALLWVNHWRRQLERTAALRKLGLRN
jgi:hypothetical protein